MTAQGDGPSTAEIAGVRPTASDSTGQQAEDARSTAADARPAGAQTAAPETSNHPLLGDSHEFLERWNAIQTTFVDEPRQAVEQADKLVAEVIQELARVFAQERDRLEGAWSSGGEVSTEDLRQVLQRYRDFFHVLLRS